MAEPTVAAPVAKPPRVAAIDWLRGLAVILMIQAHGFDAWLKPAAKTGEWYWLIRHMSGLPSRLFLLLVGISAAIRFQTLLARGADPATIRRETAKRGLQIVGLAYLFRLQEHLLAGFKGGWSLLFRVDILNAIGASLLLVAVVATPRKGRPQIAIPVLAAAVLVALGAIVGPAHFPRWLPQPLTSYIGGQRPMSWFPLFPWGAWALTGVALGHFWLHHSRDPRSTARVFLLTGIAGVTTTAAVVLVRQINPYIIRYPSDVAQQMGPGSFFFRLGIIGGLAALSWIVTHLWSTGFSPLKQLGQTSLLVYWIHVDLCYGGIARLVRGRLTIPQATLGIALLTLLMLAVSIVKTRHGRAIVAWIKARVVRRPPSEQPRPLSAGGVSR